MFPQLGLMEMLIVMGVAVLLFGKRLPEVGRSLGRGIVEFKKGLNGAAEEFDYNTSSTSYSSSYSSPKRYDETPRSDSVYDDASVPKFELPGTASSSASVPQMEYQPRTPSD